MEGTVQIIGDAGEISHVLKKRKERKEDRHGGEHHCDHPKEYREDSIDQKPTKPRRRTEQNAFFTEKIKKKISHPREPLRGIIGNRDGEKEGQEKQEQHEGVGSEASRQNAIQLSVKAAVRLLRVAHRATAELLGFFYGGGGDDIRQVIGGHAHLGQL